MSRPVLLIFIFSLFLPTVTKGQEITRITGSYTDMPFFSFVQEIESKTDYRFYFNSADIDSTHVTYFAQRTPLTIMLVEVFKGSDLHFAVYNEKIIITKKREIQTELPAGFFNESNEMQSSYETVIFDFMGDDKNKKKNKKVEIIYEVGVKTNIIRRGKAIVTGFVRNEKTGEPVIGAVIYNERRSTGVVTNAQGYYSILLPTGKNDINVSCIGMKDLDLKVFLYSEGHLDFKLQEDIIALEEVVIESEKKANVYKMQMGFDKLNMKTIKLVPMAMGEVDILKAILALPGVKTVGESSTGLNVRGGTTSQNLILLDDATIYNPFHLFGFFGAFNPDIVKNIELYKCSTPAEFGGRASSVLNVESKNGNKEKISGSGGLGLVTSRLNIDGPIYKDKMSFVIGGRSTYSDWILKKLPDDVINKCRASFYDLNSNLSYDIDKKNSLFFTSYFSHDHFKLGDDSLYIYNNFATSLKWKHAFNNKLYATYSASYSSYNYKIVSDFNPENSFKQFYNINQYQGKADFNLYKNEKHYISFGTNFIYYRLNPGEKVPIGESKSGKISIHKEQAIESAIYIEDQYSINHDLTLNIGLRYSIYGFIGPNRVVTYSSKYPNESDILDTVSYNSGQPVKKYSGPELRIAARYLLSPDASVKVSYQRMRQNIHMLSNTVSISPADIWKLSDSYVKPEISDQIAAGIYKNLSYNKYEVSIEGYYKWMTNCPDYKSGARLTLNPNIEREIFYAVGTAYGFEFLIKKQVGRLNGWICYTYSRSFLKTNSKSSEIINNGKKYPSNFDKPHDITFIGNYRFSKRYSISLNVTYSTGRPVSLPLGKFKWNNGEYSIYSDRNQYRIPDYFRSDFSFNIDGNHRLKKLSHNSWSFSIYNLTGRNNAYSVYFKPENGVIKGYKLSVFAHPIPTITYNFRF